MVTIKQQQDEFKSVKQRLSAIQLVIKKDLKDGWLPRADDLNHFIVTSSGKQGQVLKYKC